MPSSRRPRVTMTILALAVLLIGGIAVLAVASRRSAVTVAAPGDQSPASTPSPAPSPAPPTPCPLTGAPPPGGGPVPQRPALAVKVENTIEAYPLAGLQKADIIYEELVEGGITRFMAVYQCQDAPKVGPVRSARTTDPKLLVQFNKHPILGYSGAQLAVTNALSSAGILAYDETTAAAAFHRAPAPRFAPHNLFLSTPKLYARAGSAAQAEGAPEPVFTYGAQIPKASRKVRAASIQFSSSSVADWKRNPATSTWVRQLARKPMMLESGGPLQTANLIVQEVVVTQSRLVDVLGNYSPEVTLTGTGRAWLLRNGRMVQGTWRRTGPLAVTRFKTKSRQVMQLAPGTTFVELMPKGQSPTFTK